MEESTDESPSTESTESSPTTDDDLTLVSHEDTASSSSSCQNETVSMRS